MPTPSSTASFTTPTASISPAIAFGADPPDRPQRIDHRLQTCQKITASRAPASQATSSRIAGRHHLGISGRLRRNLQTKCSTTANGTERGGKPFSRGHLYTLLSNPIYTGQIAHRGGLHPGQQPALIDDESWSAVRDQLAANTSDHRRRAKAAEPSLLAGLLVDARGERLPPSHAVKKGRRYRYYVSAALITDAGTDRAQGWRLAAREIDEVVIRILSDALTSPARFVERFGAAGMTGDQLRRLLSRAVRVAAVLGGSPG